jgi:hypothetical protein
MGFVRRRRPVPGTALAVVGLLVLGACAGDVSPAAPETSLPGARPGPVAGIPQVTVMPPKTGIGDRIRIDGTGFTDPMWRTADAPLWLAATSTGGCNLYAEPEGSVTVSREGRLWGEFTVPDSGGCRMSDQERFLTAGTYLIVFACAACIIGELGVTTSARACSDVAFRSTGGGVASDLVAAGMGCAEAHTVVRLAGAVAGPVDGPATLTLDGFTCMRTGGTNRGLPSANWLCQGDRGKVVTFRRT